MLLKLLLGMEPVRMLCSSNENAENAVPSTAYGNTGSTDAGNNCVRVRMDPLFPNARFK